MIVISSWRNVDSFKREDKLSSYGFFVGKLAELKPAEGIYQYELNTPLFSNYAEKLRFIKFPEGTQADYNDTTVFNFPVGAILIKNFYYANDFRRPEKGRRILETRLLVHEEEGWQAYPYIWNDDQTEALYDPAGETKNITYINPNGKKVSTPYVIPNKNQCKGCHIRNSKMVPIGPSARQLNRDISFSSKTENQLSYWRSLNLLKPFDAQSVPKLAQWDNSSALLNDRARAYLDANCGHCHSRGGPASTSTGGAAKHSTAPEPCTIPTCSLPGTCTTNSSTPTGRGPSSKPPPWKPNPPGGATPPAHRARPDSSSRSPKTATPTSRR